MVTPVPTGPWVGLMVEMVGASTSIVNVLAEAAVPTGVVMDAGPVMALKGTTAVMLVEPCTVKVFAEAPPKVTANVPVRLVPVTVTVSPTWAERGATEVIVGSGGGGTAAASPPPPPLQAAPKKRLIAISQVPANERNDRDTDHLRRF